ncbi:hypothetical protein AOXY_G34614 [Acipenser oxyrinchus oxyrinchus]|uniref:Ig-like domain-containing protein n=1 Tax=Acipenser oxyrinchus oxyrinchus TaxID=40147 RepID=A0AAD8CF80_ACIOX|nr:hypothetical protein AOXY_G34614 [Acipenser oxyrinchus oxyrinchus]
MLKAQWCCLLRAARRVFNHTALRTPGAMAFCSIGCLLVLVAHYGLTEPVIDAVTPLRTAEPGGNITMKCGVDPRKVSTYSFAEVTWYRQEPDGRIRIVTYLNTLYLKAGRYSGTLDKNGQYHLTIADLHRNDSAVYFCIARAALLFVPGSSTKLVVSDSLTVPSVELYSPGLFEGDSDWTEPVPVLCLVRDTSPGRHRVLWTIGAEAPAPGSAEEGEIEPDGSYSVRSYVTINADQWNSGAVKCEVYNNITNVTEKASSSHRRQDCVPVLFYGLPAVLLLILVVVSVSCVYRRFHKTKTDHKSSDAPCRPQRPARHRTVQDYSTEYASLNL